MVCDSSMPTSPPELEVAPACDGMARTQLATPPSVAPPSQQLGVVAAYPTLMVDEITPTTRSAGAAGLAAFHADRVAARPGYDSTENPLADAERPPNTTELFPPSPQNGPVESDMMFKPLGPRSSMEADTT